MQRSPAAAWPGWGISEACSHPSAVPLPLFPRLTPQCCTPEKTFVEELFGLCIYSSLCPTEDLKQASRNTGNKIERYKLNILSLSKIQIR